jgi:CAAX protease family protein
MVVPAGSARYGFGAGKAFLWCLLFLLVTQIVPGVLGFVIYYAMAGGRLPAAAEPGQVDIPPQAMQIALSLTEIFGIGFSLLILRWHAGRDWARKIALRLPSALHVVLLVMAMPALLTCIGALEQVVVRGVPSLRDIFKIPGIEDFVQSTKSWPWWLAVLTIGVGPAISEELWCRGFLGRGLVARYGFVGGVLATSFFFGLIHLEPPQAVMAALLGVVLHTVYILTRSLLMPMLLHFLNNTLAILAISETRPLPVLQTLESAHEQSPYWFTAAAILLVAAAGYAMYQTRARLAPTREGMPAWQPPCATVALPPSGSGTVLIQKAPSPATVILVVISGALFGLLWFGIG